MAIARRTGVLVLILEHGVVEFLNFFSPVILVLKLWVVLLHFFCGCGCRLGTGIPSISSTGTQQITSSFMLSSPLFSSKIIYCF